MKDAGEVVYFSSPAEFRRWLEKHHGTEKELWVGYHKKGSEEPTLTWPESVDEALCFGWIDGVRKSVDDTRYKIRFTPRKTGSVWSTVNINRVAVLSEEKRMRPAGLEAFEARKENRSGIYAYEQKDEDLPEPYAGRFREHEKAWDFYQTQPPGYRKRFNWWVVSAKQEATRMKRLEKLIVESAAGRRL